MKKPGIVVSVGTNQASQQVLRTGDTQASEAGKNYDLLSSSLAQAQIDLDPFQFIEDGSLSKGVSSSESSVDIPIGENIAQSDTVSSSSVSSAGVPGEVEKIPKSGRFDVPTCSIWAASSEEVPSGMHRICRFTSSCTYAVSFGHMLSVEVGVVGWCEGVLYLTSPGRPTDIGLQLGKACYPCSR